MFLCVSTCQRNLLFGWDQKNNSPGVWDLGKICSSRDLGPFLREGPGTFFTNLVSLFILPLLLSLEKSVSFLLPGLTCYNALFLGSKLYALTLRTLLDIFLTHLLGETVWGKLPNLKTVRSSVTPAILETLSHLLLILRKTDMRGEIQWVSCFN